MKLCITSQGDNLDSNIDPRLGRCKYFIFYDTETKDFEAVKNEGAMAFGGAGVHAGQIIAEKGAQQVITGNVGPNAFKVLSEAGIPIITGISGTVREAIEKYQSGELKEVKNPTVGSKFGMNNK